MLEKQCLHQSIVFNEDRKIYPSVCHCNTCERFLQFTTHRYCKTCPHKQTPDEKSQQEHASIFPRPLAQRSRPEQLQILGRYCLKCKLLNKQSGGCEKMAPLVPVDDFVAVSACHCPLELW